MSFLISGDSPLLINTKLDVANNPWRGQIISLAEKDLVQPLLSVVDKEVTPPSRDKRDWMNLADYTWPNPDTENGLPYITRDGEANPDAARYDRRRYNRFVLTIIRLGAAWQLTGDQRFADKAMAQLRHWFIAPDTGMKPNLNYCHYVPGEAEGRRDGLIVFCSSLASVLEIWRLFHSAKLIGEEGDRAMISWVKDFLHWYQTNAMSLSHAGEINNHGSFHDLLEIYLLLFVGRNQEAHNKVEESLDKRLATQILESGEMPMETRRTLSAQYSMYNLKALYCLAHLADLLEVDGWRRGQESPEILCATEYLYRYAVGDEPWPFQQIESPNWWYLAPLCRVANEVYEADFDVSRIPLETNEGEVPMEPVIFLPGWELIFAPSHQQHLPLPNA